MRAQRSKTLALIYKHHVWDNANPFPKGTSPPQAFLGLSSNSSVRCLEPEGLMAAPGEGVRPGCSLCTLERSIPVAVTEWGRRGGDSRRRSPGADAGQCAECHPRHASPNPHDSPAGWVLTILPTLRARKQAQTAQTICSTEITHQPGIILLFVASSFLSKEGVVLI